MKRNFFLILCAALSAAGCQTDEIAPAANGVFTLTAESSAVSKTVLDTETMSASWEGSDELSVVVSNSKIQAFKFVKSSEENTFYTENFTPDAGKNEYFVIFPYSESHDTYSEPYVSGLVDIAAGVQNQSGISDAGHIDAPLYGYAAVTGISGPTVKMRHLSALIKVSVSNETESDISVKGITLSSEDAVLGGRYRVGGKDDTPEISLDTEGSNSISLNVSDGGIRSGETADFYLTCAPFTLSEGETLTVSADLGTDVKEIVKTAPAGGWTFAAGTLNKSSISVSSADFGDEPLSGNVTAYPAIEGLAASPAYTVRANNMDIWTEDFNSSQAAFARFATDGPARISVYTNTPVSTCTVHPESRNIAVTGLGTKKLTFDISGPEKLYVEIDGMPELYIFADAPETDEDKAAKEDPTYLYYGPGIHEIENTLVIDASASKKNIYIDAGAIVKGCIEFKTKGTIRGRGILDASGKNGEAALKTHYTSGTNVHDILVRTDADMPVFLDNFSVYTTISGAKFIGTGADNIGLKMHVARGMTFTGNFVRSSKDCVVINSSEKNYDVNSSFKNSTLWATSGSGLFFGMEGKGLLGNITVSNCDIIGAGGTSATGYGNAGITLCCDGPGPVQDISFDDIRIEGKISHSNLNIIVTDARTYLTSGSQVGKPGSISDITFTNVTWKNAAVPMHFIGYSADNTVSGITFTDCLVGGEKLTASSAYMQEIEMNEFAEAESIAFQ